MKQTAILVFLAVMAAGSLAQDAPPTPKPQKEHEWLQQLVGEWETEGEAITEPDKPPVKTKGSENNRSIGGFWVQGEHKGDFFGTPFTGVMTLGYDAEKKKYIGTWVDSILPHLWKYEGTVDATGKILTLESEGPGPEPGKLAKYRDSLEIKSKDHKVLTSATEKDGKWVTYLTVQYRRKK
jgi:hypothetical protein